MKPIGELLNLPEVVQKGDFVLRLSDGVKKSPQATVSEYVVTPELISCFNEALTLIQSSISEDKSKAAYLHGSFGSGKSHFMAILYLLLSGDATARSKPELREVVSKHGSWTTGKKFLMIPYHLLAGKNQLEEKILGGYVDEIKRLHPDASTPPLFKSDGIIDNARLLRKQMGDDTFFDNLKGKGDGGWGKLSSSWNAESFEQAANAEPTAEDRLRLVSDLVDAFFPGVKDEYGVVDLDKGLSIISLHAKKLGYDAVILFLDELFLWLTSLAGDTDLVAREGQKIAKLVEAQESNRPIPIVSFIARQRDIKELIGDDVLGAEKVSLGDVLDWMEGRFNTIVLEDRNLPVIAEKRVLVPKSEQARAEIDHAFHELSKNIEHIMDILLTDHWDREAFRKVYPFSPALIDALVAISSLLQRERTALKVMLQLLLREKERLKLGEIIPVGDLFDVISEGDEAFTAEMKSHFDNARRLYEQKLLPLLEREHKIRKEKVQELSYDDPIARRFRADDRLMKTLLLGALIEKVDALKGLTGEKLSALNHGSIRTPIPSDERKEVLQRVRRWASQVGEIKVSEEANPIVRVHLLGVDTDAIIQLANEVDTYGNRVHKLKDIIFTAFGFGDEGEMFHEYEFVWRDTRRRCNVRLANVRELTHDQLQNSGTDWNVLIDWPFDKENRGPHDDLAKIEGFRAQNPEGTGTICWLPSFLSKKAQNYLGDLVKLDHILKPNLFEGFVKHLAVKDRENARAILENQRSQLRNRVIALLEEAYGLRKEDSGDIDQTHRLEPNEHIQSLDESVQLKSPVAPNLRAALDNLVEGALKAQFPKHPDFGLGRAITSGQVKGAFSAIQETINAQDGRYEYPREKARELKALLVGLNLARVGETHMVLRDDWALHFQRRRGSEGAELTVANLRRWIDDPEPWGLSKDLSDLVILSFAAQTNKTFSLYGSPVTAELGKLDDRMELREEVLPSEEEWEVAKGYAHKIFGVPVRKMLNSQNVAEMARKIGDEIERYGGSAEDLPSYLERKCQAFELINSHRVNTARATSALVRSLEGKEGTAFVKQLAQAKIDTSSEAMGASLKASPEALNCLQQSAYWSLFDVVRNTAGEKSQSFITRLKETLAADEYAVPLASAMTSLEKEASAILKVEKFRPQGGEKDPASGDGLSKPGENGTKWSVISEGYQEQLSRSSLSETLQIIDSKLAVNPKRRVAITWKIYEEK